MTAADRLAPFAAALLDPEHPLPPGLATWNGSDPAARFAVYRNNVVAALTAALADTFPVTRAVVGEPFFAALAREYVRAQPPRSPLLVEHAAGLPSFVARFPPARALPWLGALAELELARVRAGRAADAPALGPEFLAERLGRETDLSRVRLGLHPSLQRFAAPWAVVSLWAAHQGRGRIADVHLETPEAALVLRDDDEVLVLPVPPEAVSLGNRLAGGATLGACLEAGDAPGIVEEVLTLLVRHGAIVAWHVPGDANR